MESSWQKWMLWWKKKKKKRSKLERKGANFISKIEVLPERCELLMLKVENLMQKIEDYVGDWKFK